MYNSEMVRIRILEIMSDGIPYKAKDLKSIIRNESAYPISEGIFANSFHSLAERKQIQLISRGCYQIMNPTTPVESSFKKKEEIAKKFSKLTEEYKKNVLNLLNSINISKDDMNSIEYARSLRKKIEQL